MAAATGCAIQVLSGEGRDQIHKLAKTGKVDAAADIALGMTLDCIFGAIPMAMGQGLYVKFAGKIGPKVKGIIKVFIRRMFR